MKATLDNYLINYNDMGSDVAQPIIFIHGFPFSWRMWYKQEEYFCEHYRTITYDIRGHGDSSMGEPQFMVEYFVDDFFRLVNFLNIKKAVVVGLSMGGYIALRAYEKKPDIFRALVLCDTKSEADTNDAKIKRANQAQQVKIDGAKKFSEEFVKNVFAKQSFTTLKGEVEMIKEIISKTETLSIAATLIALAARTDTTHVLPTIDIPTLILVGEHDTITPVANSQAMKEKIPNAEMKIIPNAAHMSNLENADVFNSTIENFLKKL